MSPRVTAGLLVTALIRAIEAAGGQGMVLAKGDATSGAILLVLADRGRTTALVERTLGMDDRYAWTTTGPGTFVDPFALTEYLDRRRSRDPDLWLVELDHADPLSIAAEMIA